MKECVFRSFRSITSDENENADVSEEDANDEYENIYSDGSCSSLTFSAKHVEKINSHLKTEVARISAKNSLTHTATNDILCLLRDLGHDVPKDARTLLGTTREKATAILNTLV